MKDQDLIDLTAPRIPDEWRRKYLSRPIERLPADVCAAFDRIQKVEREKDSLRGDYQELRRNVNVLYWIVSILISLAAVAAIVATIK